MVLEKSISFITPTLFIKMSNPPRMLMASLNVPLNVANNISFKQVSFQYGRCKYRFYIYDTHLRKRALNWFELNQCAMKDHL